MIKKTIINKKTGKLMNLAIYDGFSSMDSLLNHVSNNYSLKEEHVAIVKFLGMYYGIVFDGYEKEIMIGLEKVWYRQGGKMYEENTDDFIQPYYVSNLSKKEFFNKQVYLDLKSLDKDIEIYVVKIGKYQLVNQYRYASCFAILLGITFYTDFYSDYEYQRNLYEYFDTSYFYTIFKNNKSIAGINPFQSRVLLKDGRIRKHNFYK